MHTLVSNAFLHFVRYQVLTSALVSICVFRSGGQRTNCWRVEPERGLGLPLHAATQSKSTTQSGKLHTIQASHKTAQCMAKSMECFGVRGHSLATSPSISHRVEWMNNQPYGLQTPEFNNRRRDTVANDAIRQHLHRSRSCSVNAFHNVPT